MASKEHPQQSVLESSSDGPRLVLRIDFPEDCLAGTFVSGRVYLVLPASTSSTAEHWQGISVRLEGYEHSFVIPPGGGGGGGGGGAAEKESPLILTEQPVVLWSSKANKKRDVLSKPSTEQQLEYPFRWRLPSNLPASMQCRKGSTNEQCRIEYKITAFLVSRLGTKVHPSTVQLCVRSHAVSTQGQAVDVAPKSFGIKTAMVFSKGSIKVGLKLSTDILSPGANLRVGVYGANHSKVAVKDFVVRLIERASWTIQKDFPDEATVTDETILAEERLWTSHAGVDHPWQANDTRRYLPQHDTMWTMLCVPDSGCRSSYKGELIRIDHFVLVIAETAADMTTNPRCRQAVRLVNASRGDQMLQQKALMVLPTHWEPTVAPIMEIPDTLVVPHAEATVAPSPDNDASTN